MKVESVRFDLTREDASVTVVTTEGEETIGIGSAGNWVTGTSTVYSPALTARPVAATGTWVADDTYLVTLAFYETPFCPTYRARFEGDRIELETKNNVGFGPNEPQRIIGSRVR
jgi:hypothetical protein